MSKCTRVWLLATLMVGVFLVFLRLTTDPDNSKAESDAPPEKITLAGILRDFKQDHPDFDVSSAGGHQAGNVASELDENGLPVYTGQGRAVVEQFYDRHGDKIMPYGGVEERGLPGGHFDVDVFEGPDQDKRYHKHEYDDSFNVNYIDIANDEHLLFREIVGKLNTPLHAVAFLNPQNGGLGTYSYVANGERRTGKIDENFKATFQPKHLTEFKLTFKSLLALAPSSPGDSQGDKVDRNGAFGVRFYSATTGDLVYEVTVYHHAPKDFDPDQPVTVKDYTPDALVGECCGQKYDDTPGTYGALSGGGITDNDTFKQWYTDVLRTNMSKPVPITLERGSDGIYSYQSDAFYPVDNGMLGNQGSAHNNFFTYAITMKFTYNQCTRQFFEFEGNDDAWAFVNGKLALDAGGVGSGHEQRIDFDRLGLVDGQEVELKFFYAHRRETENSRFGIRTNIVLQSVIEGTTVSPLYD